MTEWTIDFGALVPTFPYRPYEYERCGAKTRDGSKCWGIRVAGKRRCRMHGGRSTGPKTDAGRAAIAASNRRRAELRRTAVGA